MKLGTRSFGQGSQYVKQEGVGAFQTNQTTPIGENTTVPACMMIPKRVGDRFQDLQKSMRVGLSNGFDQARPDLCAGKVGEGGDSAKG